MRLTSGTNPADAFCAGFILACVILLCSIGLAVWTAPDAPVAAVCASPTKKDA